MIGEGPAVGGHVVVTGLPGSGKSTLGRGLAPRLGLPLLDKDEVLEALFDSLGTADGEHRARLSRASDEVVVRLAAALSGAVLVNWWHGPVVGRLAGLGDRVVEVHCSCPVEVAAARFRARRRHPGHLDDLVSAEQHEAGLARLRATYRGALDVGPPVVVVRTDRPVDLADVEQQVRDALSGRR